MANKKLMATAQLFLNTKEAKKDAQIFIDDLKQKLNDIETAADKMTVFKDMVQYIAQIDKALASLKANNKDTFNSMFDGLDVNLKKQLEGVFGIDGAKLGQLDVLRDTLNNLTTKASIKEIREFAKSLNEIYEGIGHKAPFEDIENQFKEFSKEAKAKHIETLSNQLSNFATVWKNVNSQISKGFGVGGSGFGGVSGLTQEVQNEIDKLKKQAEEISDIVNIINNPKKVKVTLVQQSENQVEQLKNLKEAFISAAVAKKQFETNKMTGTQEYLNSVAKYIQSAAELKSAFESTKLTKAGNEWIMSSGLGALQDADNVLDKFFVQNKDLMDKVVNMYRGKIHDIGEQISFLEKPYDTLKSKMEEYADLQKKMNRINNTPNGKEQFSKDEINAIDEKIQELEKYLFALDKVGDKQSDINKILASVMFNDAGGLAAAEQMCKLFGVDIPDAVQKTEAALKSVGGSAETTDAGSVIGQNSGDIIEETKQTVDAIDYAKKELTKAWQEYYRVAQKAKNNDGLILEDGETSPEMDKIKDSIDKKIDSLGAVAVNPSKWGVKVDLDLSDAIADRDIDANGIEREIDKLIKQHGISFNIPVEEINVDAINQLDNTNIDVQQSADTVVDTIELAKQKIVGAFKVYYRAIQEAKNAGFNTENSDMLPDNVNAVYNAMQDMFDKFGLLSKQKTAFNGKLQNINYDEIAFDDIGNMVDNLTKFFEVAGSPLQITASASDIMAYDFFDNISQVGDTAAKEFSEATTAIDNAEDELIDTQTAFQNLVNYISQSGDKPAKFFDKLESGAQSVDDELKSILQSLNLIDASGNVNLSSIKSGFTNKGGFVSDNYTMIARRITGPYGQDYLGKSEKLQTQLASAQQAGAQIGAIFDLIKDEAHGLFYEIQNTVPGTAAFSHHKMDVNTDVLNASKDQLSDLVHTMKALSDNGLFIDFGGDNILYDKDKGFSIIDLGLVGDQYHTVSSQNTLQENLDRFIKEYFKFAPSDMHADIQTMLADTLYNIAQGVDANIVNPNSPSKQQSDSNNRIIAATKAEKSAHEQNTDAIKEETAALEALIQLKAKAQNMKWKDFAKDESLTGLKDAAGFTSVSQLEKFWKQARYDKQIDFHEISKNEADKIFDDKLTPGLASKWYSAADFNAKDQLENEILEDDELRNAALNYMYYLYQNHLPSAYKNQNVKNFDDFLNTEFTLYRGDESPLIYGDESKLSFSWNEGKAQDFNGNIGTIKLKPKNTIGNAGSHFTSEVETFGPYMGDTSWFKQTNETFEEFYSKQTKEMQNEINAGLVNLEKRRIQDLLDENISRLTHKAGKDTEFQNGILKQFQQGDVPKSFDVVGDRSLTDKFAAAYNGLSDIDKKLVAYYANLEAISNALPKQFSELPKSVVGEDANLFNAVLNDPSGVQKHVAKLTGESKFGILGQNAQDINLEANMHKLNTQAIEEETKAQQELNQNKSQVGRMFDDVSTKLHKDAENKDTSVVRDLSEIWDGAKSISKTIDGPYADQDIIDMGGYINHITGEVTKVKDLINKVNNVMANTGIDLSYVQDYISEMYKGADLDEIDKAFSGVMGVDSKSYYDSVSDNLKRLVDSKQAGSEEFNMLAHVWHQIKHVDWTDKNGGLEDLINNGEYFSNFSGETLNVSDLYAFIDDINQKWGTNLIEVKDYLNKVFAKYNQNPNEGYKLDEDLILDLDDDFDLDDIDDQPVDNIAVYNNAFNQALSEYASATGKKEEKLHKLIEYLKEVQTTEQESIDDGEIQLGVDGETAKIEDVYALVEDIQNKHATDLGDVKYYLDQVFETYNKKTSTTQTELLSTEATDKIDYWDVKDKLFDEVFAGHDEDVGEKLKILLSNLSDVNLSSKDLVDDGKVEDLLHDSSYDIEEVYGLVEGIQKQYGINLDYVKDYLNQVYEAYNNKIDLDALHSNFNEADLDLSDDVEKLSLQSKKYSVEDYEGVYKSQDSNSQSAINQMAIFYQEYTKLKDVINSEPIEFLISPQNATIDEIKAVQQALDEFKAIQQEITNMPLINTKDDAIKLKDLQAKALGLQNKLKSAELPSYIPDGYDDVFNLSESDAELMNKLVGGPDVNLLNQALDTAHNLHVDKMYDAISDEFSVMIAEDASDSLNEFLLKLGEELKLEQQITSEKEQQRELQEQIEDTVKNDKSVKVEQSPKLDTSTSKVVGGDYALESTLQQTNSILGNILTATQTEGNNSSVGTKQQESKQPQDASPEDPFKKNLYNKTNSFNKYKKDLEGAEYVTDSLNTELNELGTKLHQISNQDDLDGWAKQFNSLKDNIKAAQSVFEQENIGKINLYQRELTNSFNKLPFAERESLFEEYSEVIVLLNKQKQAVKEGHEVELAGIKQITAALQEEIDKRIEANKVAKDAEKAQKKNAKFGDTAMINATAKHNSLSQIAKSDQFIDSAAVKEALSAYDQAYTEMKNMRDKLNNKNEEITDSDREAFKAATTECNEYAKALDKLIKNSIKMHNTKNHEDYILGSDFVDDKNGRIAALTDFAKSIYGVDLAATDFKDDWNKVVFAVDNGDGTFTQMTATFTDARNEIVALAGDTKKAQGAFGAFFDELKGKFKSIGAYLVASFSFHEVWQVIRQGINYVREIDSALTELKKVTDETDASYAQFLQDMSKTGAVIGATVKDLTTMSAEWARLGYSLEESAKLAESTAILLNVSEFKDATAASEALISTMQAFQYTADESGHVVDILNEVGNNFAVSSDGLAIALQDSASALMEGGNNLEQAVALVAAANRVVQDPNSVGSALRTISLRLRGTSVEVLEELGEETDNVVESTSKLQEKIKALSGVDILTDAGDYKDTYTILKEIGNVWEDMSDIDQAALLELMAGKNRANTLSAILSNMRDLEGAYESALNAEGSALKENAAYLDSIQGRIDLFNNSVQTMWMNLIDSETVKSIVDAGTALIKFMDAAGAIPTAVGGFALVKSSIKAISAELDAVKKGTSQFSGMFTKATKEATEATQKESNVIEYNFKTKQKVTKATEASTVAKKMENAAQKEHIAGNTQEIVSDSLETKGTWAQVAAEKALAVAKGLGKGILIGLAGFAISSILTGLITSITEASQEMEKLTQNAIDSANEVNSARDSINDYKEEIKNLRDVLADNTSTEQEAYDARARLIEIQNDLTDTYGQEANNINLVTGAIDEQITKLDELSKKKAAAWFLETDENNNTNQKAYDNASNIVNQKHTTDDFILSTLASSYYTSYDNSTRQSTKKLIDERYTGELNNLSNEAVIAYHDGLQKIIEKYNGTVEEAITSSGAGNNSYTLKSYRASFENKTAEELNQIFQEINSYIDAFEVNYGVDLSAKQQELGKILGSYYDEEYQQARELYDLGRQQKAISQYDMQYGAILDAEERLKESISDGDRLAAIREYGAAVDQAIQSTVNQYTGEVFDAPMNDFFTKMREKFVQEEFELQIKVNEDNLKTNLTNIINESGEAGLSSLDNNQMTDLVNRIKNGEFEAGPEGTYVDYSRYTKEQVNGIAKLQKQADAAGISIDTLIDSLVNLGLIESRPKNEAEKIAATVSSIDALTSAVEAYQGALKVVNDISFDGQAISKDYYDTLKGQLSDVTVGIEDFSDAIDEQNGKYIVKNVTLLKKLVTQSKKARKATIEVARSQAQLQYRDIVDQMRNAVMIMGIEYDAYNFITDATFDNISAMREQIDTLKQTIQQYALLEVSLSNAASAYDEYESAKERDAQLSYDESFLEMLKTIDEGLLKNETGSEAFEYSVRAVVREDVWSGIEDPNEKVKAIHDYIDGDKTFSKLFHVDKESGELDINTDNVREFIKLSKEAGMITGGPEGFELSDTVYGTKEWAKALGITEAAVLALLSATEDCDALWGNILTDVMTHPLDREINKSVDEVDEATKKLEDYLKLVKETNGDEDTTNDVEFDSEYYSQLISDIGAATTKLKENQQAALDNAQAYNTVQSAISSFRGDLALTDSEATNLVGSLKEIEGLEDLGEVVIEDGQLKLTNEQLTLILGKLGKIKEPSVVQVQLRYDEITNEIDQINEYIKEGSTGSITIDGIVFTNGADADGHAIEDYLAKLTAEQKEIQLTYNITETSTEEQKSVLESYQEMAKNGVEFTVTAIVDDAKEGLDSVSDAQQKIKEKQTITFSTNASTVEQAIKSFADEYDRIASKVITLTVNVDKKESVTSTDPNPIKGLPIPGKGIGDQPRRISRALGNARANGNTGLSAAEHDAVVGEIGPELVVDPIKGIYYTVGENGTEMVNLPKGAIIYNHKQTEELLNNGHTTRGHYTGGLSFASGNAHADYGIPSYHPNLKDKTSFENGPGINTTWDDAASTLTSAANKISDAMSDAADSVGEFEETIDWIEIRMEEYDEVIGKLSAELENLTTYEEKNAKISEIVAENQKKYADSLAGAKYYEDYAQKYLEGMNSTLVEAAQNGAIAITEFTKEQDEATIKAIQNYRDYAQKAAELRQQAEEIITEIADLAKQAFDNVVNEFENELSFNDIRIEQYEAHNSLLETDKGFASENIYQKMIEENDAKLKILEQQRAAMQAELDSGKIEVGSDDWYDAVNAISEVNTEIVNLNTEIEDLQDNINELHWEQFDLLMTQFQAVSDEAENLIDILGTKDAVDEFGNWTDEGITSIGLLAQQMEVAEKKADKYKQEIQYLNDNWKKLGYTQEEYVEKLDELKSGQYDAINSYHDAKNAIVELNEARVDAIKDGIQKEIDAYEELIEKKKEELDAEKDLYDFQKGVADQQKDIADIERKLAALSSDNSASARAQRAKLEAELYEAKAALEETYYDRSISNQQDALDKELEGFQEEKDKEIEGWEKYLESVELVVSDSLAMVQENTSTVLATLTTMGQEFGLTITEALTAPWKAGEAAIQEYGAKLNISLTQLAAMFGMTVDQFAAKLGLTTTELVSSLDITVAQLAETLGLTSEEMAARLGLTVTNLNGMMDMSIQQLAANMGITLPILAERLGTTTAGLAGNLEMTMVQFAGKMGLTVDELASKFGLTTTDLATKLGMTYQDLVNPFGLAMSATVDALKALETEYSNILASITGDSEIAINEVNKAMQKYEDAKNKKQQAPVQNVKPAQPAQQTQAKKAVDVGSKVNAGSARIYADSYGGGGGTQYFASDPNYVVLKKSNGYVLVRHHSLSSGYTGWFKESDLKAYAKGTTSLKESGIINIDELGEELILRAQNGRLTYMEKGSGIIPADLTSNLMEWGKLDPSMMLDQNRPSIGVHPEIHNTEINLNITYGDMVSIGEYNGGDIKDLEKMVTKQFEKHTKDLNNALRKFVR